MPCNCGNAKNLKPNYLYVAPDGKQTVYDSEAQAMAAKIKNKGGYYTTVPKG